jgi:hypothetical protein
MQVGKALQTGKRHDLGRTTIAHDEDDASSPQLMPHAKNHYARVMPGER